MKRRNRHVVLLGNGMRIVNIGDLHKQAGLHVSPASYIYPSELGTNLTFSGC